MMELIYDDEQRPIGRCERCVGGWLWEVTAENEVIGIGWEYEWLRAVTAAKRAHENWQSTHQNDHNQ